MTKMWGGRFRKKTSPLVERFTSSIEFDKRLAEFDCLASIAHIEMLGSCKIISKKESLRIVSGLKSILRDIREGNFRYSSKEEDIHTAIQSELYKKIGPVAGKLHTARSRNDQITVDTRMYCKKEIDSIIDSIVKLRKSIIIFSKKNIDVIIPGLTHLQYAQPVLVAHQMLAYCDMIARDIERLKECRKRVDVLPLGSCAIAGTSLPIDRKIVAKKLGFRKVSSNSIDGVSDRDFVIELIFNLSVMAMHLSRISEDFIIWNSETFRLIEIKDELCTGSSMMPQKKNPDVLELVRGKSGEIYGSLMSVLTMMKALPFTYNRDLQQDKEALFRSVDTIKDSLAIMNLIFRSLRINKKRALELLQEDAIYATDIMEYLVKKGVPQKQAHEVVGKIILYCIDNKLRFSELTLKRLRLFSPYFNADVYDLLNPWNSVKAKHSEGSTNPAEVRRRLLNA